MVSLTHLLTFFFILSFVLLLGYSSVPESLRIKGDKTAEKSNEAISKLNSLSETMNSSISIQTNMPLLGTIVFPNVFAIFYGIFNSLWTMLQLPSTLFNNVGIPPIVVTGISGVLLLLLALTVIDWFKH